VADVDPLLFLLRRYQIECEAFDDAPAIDGITDQDRDRIAQATWSRTQDQIIQSEPPATSAAGALLALDHVLQSDDLFAERSECADLQMLWLLVKAARDYVALVGMQHNRDSFLEGGTQVARQLSRSRQVTCGNNS
jgi:hypothetical protein